MNRVRGGARGKTEDARTLEKHMMAERRNAPEMRGAQTEKSFWSSVCSVSDRHRFCKALCTSRRRPRAETGKVTIKVSGYPLPGNPGAGLMKPKGAPRWLPRPGRGPSHLAAHRYARH